MLCAAVARPLAARAWAPRRPPVAAPRATAAPPVFRGTLESAKTVHVISTQADHLFGVHRLHPQHQTYTSFVMAFRQRGPAESLAKALDMYHGMHGHYPARDLGALNAQLRECLPQWSEMEPARLVRVDSVEMEHLLQRLAGTRIVVLLVTIQEGQDEEPTLEWEEFFVDEGVQASVEALERTLGRLGSDAQPPSELSNQVVPGLLPKPQWPPGTHTLCGLLGMAMFQTCVVVDMMLSMFREDV